MLSLITADIELICPAGIYGSFFVVVLSSFPPCGFSSTMRATDVSGQKVIRQYPEFSMMRVNDGHLYAVVLVLNV